MKQRRMITLLLAIAILMGIFPGMPVMAKPTNGDVAGDWPMPVEGTYDLKGHMKKMHIQYDGVGENTIEFSLQFQSTVSPPGINHVDFRVDPRIKEYVTKVEGKGKGALSLGESYVGFKDRNAAPGQHNKNVYRAKLDGPTGLFTALPWGAQVYEAKIIVHLNKKVSELKALFPDRHYTFETRAVGTEGGSIDGEIIKIDKNSLNSATFVKFDDQVFTEDDSRWLRSNSTALVEYESGGTLTTNKDNARSGAGRERVPFGQGVMRIKYYIYPHMMIWDSYNAQIDQYKHYSFELDIDPKLKDLIPDDAKIRVNALRLYGGAYNHVELPISYINADNQLRVSIYGTEKRNNEDKNVNQVVDPLVTKHNMYISADADGSLPTYLQIEIPIDETKAEQNFDYNQYNFQGFYYNRRGQLVKNSLARSFTNAAKTDQMPTIMEGGTALLWSDEVKGNSEYPGSEIFLVANPELDPQGNGVPGTGTVIGQMTTENKDFIIKTFAKDSQAYDPENPNLFKDIINPATGETYKAGQKVYVFQAKPGRMMSKGIPVTLIEEQTNKPEVDHILAKQLVQGALGERYFKIVSGSVEKINQEAAIDVKMIWHGNGATLDNPGTKDETVSGGTVKGTYQAQRVAKGETIEQTGGKPHFIVNFDGTFSYIEDVGRKKLIDSNAEKAFQVGDIIEVVATEEHCKESVHTYYVIAEEGEDVQSRKPQAGIIYATMPDTSESAKQVDSNFNKPNIDGQKTFAIRVQGGAKWRVVYYPKNAEKPIEISGEQENGGLTNQWFDVYPQLPDMTNPKNGLHPGDKIEVYQSKKTGIKKWADESSATERIVQQHPDEYFGYTIEVYLEGKEDAQETIYVHKDGQIYPNIEGVGAAILNYIQADAPEIPFPTRLKDELMRPDRVAHNYVYNHEKSTKFPTTVTRDYTEFWENLGVSLDAANKASFAQNVFELHFDRDPQKWVDLVFDSGENGYFTKDSLVASDAHADVFMEETEGKVETFVVKGIETNVIDEKSPKDSQGVKQPRNLTWAEIKMDKGVTDINITPIASPGYIFEKYIDVDSNTDMQLNDDTTIDRSYNMKAQYKVDESQKFGYEIQYVYDTGELDTEGNAILEAVPGKDAITGEAPVETVVQINQDPVDGYKVSADQPKELTVEYVENEDGTKNNDANNGEPTMRQVVKVVYEVAESQKPVITTDPVMDTTELVEGTATPYAGIKLYYAKNIAAAGEPENWVADLDRPLGLDTTDKDGNWSVKVSDLKVKEKIIAVAKDPLKAEASSDPKDVIADANKFTGTIVINPVPKTGEEVVEGQITLNDNPNKPDDKADLIKGTIVEIFTKGPGPDFVLTKVGTAVADENGKFYAGIRPEELTAGKTLVAKAKPRKSVELETEAVVAVNPDRLNKAIVDGNELVGDDKIEEALKKYPKADVDDLKNLVDAGKALVDSAGNPKEDTTQEAADKAAKAIEDKLRNMGVVTAPIIEASNKTVTVGSAFDALDGVKVIDSQEGEITPTVESIVKVEVNEETEETTETPVEEANVTQELGTYKITYKAVNAAGKESTKTISVEVVEANKGDLKEAIAKGNAKLTDGKEYDPEKKAALDKAISDGTKVLENKNAPQAKVDKATKAINDAIAALGDQVQTATPNITEKVKNGINKVVGTAEAGAFVYIKDSENNIIGTTIADNTGKFEALTSRPLVEKEVLTVTAQADGKTESAPATTTVVPNTDKLTETIGKADHYVEGKTLDESDPIDKELKDALDHAKDIKAKAEQEPPKATQDEVDEADDRLNKALDTKKAKDAVEKAKENPTDENIQDAQDKIDKLPGNTDPTSPDYNKDKDDLQKELDKINKTPAPERVDQPLDKATTVTGKATPGSKVVVTLPKDGGKYEAVADPATGEFIVTTRPLTGGEKLEVTAKDGNKAVSDPVEATVVTDVAKLKDAIAKGDTAAEGLDPTTTDPEDKELLDAIAAGKDILVNAEDPNSLAKPGKTQKEADDAADRILAAIKAKEEADENDANAIETPAPEVKPVSNGATTVTGTAEKGAIVTVTMPDGATYTTTADGPNGEYSVTTRKLVGGEVINVTAKLPNRPVSENVPVTVTTDVNDLKAAIGEGETAMEDANTPPTAEDEALQKAIDEGKDLIVDPTAELPVAKENVTQKQADDAAKKIRDAIKAKEAADENNANAVQTPKPEKVNPVANGDKVVTGKATPGATVTVYLPDGTKAEGKADETTGEFSIPTRPLKGNEVINVTAKLPNRPESEKVEVTVGAKVAEAPKISPIAHNTTTISGTAPNATNGDTVVVKIGNLSLTATVTDGGWTVEAPRPLVSGEVVTAKVVPKDTTIDPSIEASITVGLNTTGLQESYDKADTIVNDPTFDPDKSNTDADLKKAYDDAADILEKAKDPANKITQDKVDEAKKALDDALAAKEKFEDAKKAVGEAKANPSKETIANAQEKIDAMDGSIDPAKPDYNKDKADLQKELDKIKLKEAIDEANKKLEDPNLDPTDKEAIEDAKKVVEEDLDALNDPAKEDPSHDKINEDIKNLEDAINGAKNQTKLDPLAPVKTGAQQVKGTSEEGAVVRIFVDNVEVGTTTAGADGAFTYNHDTPLNAGQVVKAIAKVEGKTDSLPQEVTVGVDISGLQDAIEKGETALTERNDGKNADTELQEAIDAGKELITPEGKPVEGKTQADVDKAEKDIRDALDKKEKTDAAEDKVKALEDKQAGDQTLPENKITPEEIVEAQQAIDAIPGSIEEGTPDYNKDKKGLQDRLDKVKAMEDLKKVVEEGKEAKEEAIADGKPQDIIDELDNAINEGKEIINNNGEDKNAKEIVTVIEKVEVAIENLSKPGIAIKTDSIKSSHKYFTISTQPGNCKLEITQLRNGEIIATFEVNSSNSGYVDISVVNDLSSTLQQGDTIKIEASKARYLNSVLQVTVD